MWRTYKNVLPKKQCLLHRKVLTKDKCDFCGDSESSGHILCGCMIAKETWNETKFRIDNLIQPPKGISRHGLVANGGAGGKELERFCYHGIELVEQQKLNSL